MAVTHEQVVMLRAVPLFAAVPERELARLGGRLRRRTFKRGEVIMHRGDPAGALHVIRSGRVKITLPSEEGDETVLALLGKGQCFGEIAALDGRAPPPSPPWRLRRRSPYYVRTCSPWRGRAQTSLSR